MRDPVVVVGASMAGLRAAEQLRAAGWEGDITVVGEEAHAPYNRPPLSKEALSGCRDSVLEDVHATVAFRQRPSVADVSWRLGTRAVAADLDARTVTLEGGETLAYSGLVVATGLRPRRLPVPGPTQGRYVLRTLDEAHALGQLLEAGCRVVVVGAGFIGCEVAATATGLGCEVTVVEPLEAPLVRALGAEVGTAVRRFHESRGVRFRCPATVTEYVEAGGAASESGSGRVGGVRLADGSVVEADVVVEAIGSVPNTEWLEGNGLDLSDGVLCDRWLRVEGRPDVVAVGDVARFPNPRFVDEPRRIEHWCTPTDTAKQAAPTLVAALEGKDVETTFGPMPSFWSDQHELRLQSFGMTGIADKCEVVSGDQDRLLDGVIVHYFLDGRLVGVLLVNVNAKQHRGQRDLVAEANPNPPAQTLTTPLLGGHRA